MPKLLVLILSVTAFSAGVLADETIKPTGWSWQKISAARQLGYVEGFGDGTRVDMEQRFCEWAKAPAMKSSPSCVLFNLRQQTLLSVGTAETLSTISSFYTSPANLPVRRTTAGKEKS